MDPVDWPQPWYPLGDDDRPRAETFERQLRRELSLGHPLFGINAAAIGKRDDCDDVLFQFDDGTGRVAVVHLVWRPSQEPPWPAHYLFASLDEWAIMERENDDDLGD